MKGVGMIIAMDENNVSMMSNAMKGEVGVAVVGVERGDEW